MYISHKPDQNGQIAVAILLIMTVMLTVAVSIAVRTSQEVSNSTQQTESTRVFNAAETGIEVALSEGEFDADGQEYVVVQGTEGAVTSYSITPNTNFTDDLREGEAASIQLENGSTPTVLWAQESSPVERAAILIAVYYSNNTVEYHAVGDDTIPNRDDDFQSPQPGTEGFYYRYAVPLAANPVAMRVIPVYASTDIKITGNVPVQQHIIRSEAYNANTGDSNEKRTIQVTRTVPAPPHIMDYALYAKGSIVKN